MQTPLTCMKSRTSRVKSGKGGRLVASGTSPTRVTTSRLSPLAWHLTSKILLACLAGCLIHFLKTMPRLNRDFKTTPSMAVMVRHDFHIS